MYSKICILKSKWDYIGFLDPLRVNERTCLGLYGCDVEDLKQRLIVVTTRNTPSRHVFFVTLVESVCTWARNDASKHDFGNVSTGYDI